MGKGMFKTSFMGGFKKSDVLSYVDELDKMSREYESRLHGELDELKKELTAAKSEKTEYEANLKKLEEVIAVANKKTEEAVAEKAEIENDLNNINTEMMQKNIELDNIRHDNLLLQQKVKQLEMQLLSKDDDYLNLREQNNKLTEKATELNKVEEQIASVMLVARRSADSMISEAKIESQVIKKNAYEKLFSLTSEVSEFNAKVASIREEMRNFYEVSDDMLEKLFDTARNLGIQFTEAAATKEEATPSVEAVPEEAAEPFRSENFESASDTTEYDFSQFQG